MTEKQAVPWFHEEANISRESILLNPNTLMFELRNFEPEI